MWIYNNSREMYSPKRRHTRNNSTQVLPTDSLRQVYEERLKNNKRRRQYKKIDKELK